MSRMRKLKVTEMGRMSVAEYQASDKQPLVVVLDHVRSLYNVGSVFRTCDAFRLSGVCLCGITAQPPHPEIHKTALGAEDSVPWRYFKQTEESVIWLKEVKGVQQQVVDMCDGCLEIPQYGTKHSLNVSVTVGIVLWHLTN